MALKAGYKGIKKFIADKLNSLSDVDNLATDAEVSDAFAGIIAPIESGDKASQAYAIGEHFIKDGKFCTAIQTIAAEATFTKNTNYVEGTIADNLLKKETFTGTTSATTGNVKISGNVLNIVSIINTSGFVFSLYTIDTGTYAGTWAHVTHPADLSPVLNTEVNIEYYYI